MYHTTPITSEADELAVKIRHSTTDERLRLQPEFGRVLQRMEQAGTAVPARLRNLHEQLLEEVIEARFDNLPI